jgi:hypothetical protein
MLLSFSERFWGRHLTSYVFKLNQTNIASNLGGSSLFFWINARHWFNGPIKAYFADGSTDISRKFEDEHKPDEKGGDISRVVAVNEKSSIDFDD